MMPEQQSFVLYIVVGSGSKNSSRLPKASWSCLQSEARRLPGNKPKHGSWLPKSGLGSPLQGVARKLPKTEKKISSPASETSSGAALFIGSRIYKGILLECIPGNWQAVSGLHNTIVNFIPDLYSKNGSERWS